MTTFTLGELAAHVGGAVVGDAGRRVEGIKTLEDAGSQHLSFYHNRRYLQAAIESAAGALLVADPAPFSERDLLVCADPYAALAALLELMHPAARPAAGVHPSAVVAASARIGDGAFVGPTAVIGERVVVGVRAVIGPGCVLGDDVEVGEGTALHPHVVIEARCRVGARCILHAGVVLGSDGFGFATVGGVHRKVPQVGVVVVEDDVELGANVCVDRAALGETRIGRGTKVDNLVQIAHNVTVGEHSLLVSQSGISGSTRLGHHVVMAGQSGAVGHITLGDGTVVTAKTGVTQDTPAGAMVSGFPSRPHKEWLRATANLFTLDELRRRVKKLEEAVRQLGGETMIDIQEILDILPHRYPFLLVDRVLELEAERILALKNVTFNEPHFTGHFPDVPVMPGVLIIEALAQAGGVMMLRDIPDRHGKLLYFAGIDNCRFRRPVVPGDQLLLEVTVTKRRQRFAVLHGVARVGDEVAAEADLSSAMVDRPKTEA